METTPDAAPPETPRSSARFRVPGGRIGMTLLLVAVVLLANSVAVRLLSEPFEAVTRFAHEQRPGAELAFQSGGHHANLIGMTAEGRFRVEAPDGAHELHLVLRRETPFFDWRIVSMSDRSID